MGKFDKLKKMKRGSSDNAFDQVEKAKNKFKATDDYVKSKIEIHPDFRDWISPLSKDEFAQLQENIIEEGCREPLVIWRIADSETYYIIDGHNRYRICTSNGVAYNIVVKEFENTNEAKEWMILNQLGRRNLTKEQIAYYQGLIYNERKSDPKKNLKRGNSPKSQNETSGNLAEEMSKEFGTSRNGILRSGKFAEGLDKVGKVEPALKQKILSGKTKVKKADVEQLAKVDVGNVEKEVTRIKEEADNPPVRKIKPRKKADAPSNKIPLSELPAYLKEMKKIHGKVVKENNGDEQYFKSLGIVELCNDLLTKLD